MQGPTFPATPVRNYPAWATVLLAQLVVYLLTRILHVLQVSQISLFPNAQDDSKYTKPALRESIKKRVMAGSKVVSLVSGLRVKLSSLHLNTKKQAEATKEERARAKRV